MRRRREVILGALLASVLLGVAVAATADDGAGKAGERGDGGSELRWESDPDVARARAAREGKPVLVVFRCEL